MALQLDLEEQEQIDQLKHFWARFGDYVVWALIVVLSSYAAWNGWQYWQRKQAAQSAVLFETVERASAGSDTALMERAFTDIKDKFGSTTYANQAAFIVSKAFYDKGETQKAEDALSWVIKNPVEAGYESLARLRLSSLLVERGALAEAKTSLGDHTPAEFLALVEDRLGDIDLLEKHPDTAATHFLKSYTALQANAPYRKFVEAKLNTLGVDPVAQSLSLKSNDSQAPDTSKSAGEKR